jgi:hypothetical protein
VSREYGYKITSGQIKRAIAGQPDAPLGAPIATSWLDITGVRADIDGKDET